MRETTKPVILLSNDPVIRGVIPYRGEEYLDEDIDDVIANNIEMSGRSSVNIVATRGTRSTQGRQDLVDSTNTGSDTSARLNEGLSCISKPQSPNKAMTAAAAPLKRDATLNNSALPHQHPPKFIDQALLEYTASRPPFVQMSREKKFLSSKRVTLATQDVGYPQTLIQATLMTRPWDLRFSFYTIDRNGERLIVRPFGHRSAVNYRAWSGHGDVFQSAPVAFRLRNHAEDQNSNDMDFDDGLESNLKEPVFHEMDDVEDEDHFPKKLEKSNHTNDIQQGSGLQGTTREPDSPESPAVRTTLTDLNTNHYDKTNRAPEVRLSIGLEPTPRAAFSTLQPRLSEASAAAPRSSEVTDGTPRKSPLEKRSSGACRQHDQ